MDPDTRQAMLADIIVSSWLCSIKSFTMDATLAGYFAEQAILYGRVADGELTEEVMDQIEAMTKQISERIKFREECN